MNSIGGTARRWGRAAAVAAAVVLLAGCGNAELEEALAATETELDEQTDRAETAEEALDDAERAAAAAERRADNAEQTAAAAAREDLAALEQELRDDINEELAERTADLNERETELVEREEQNAGDLERLERTRQAEFGDGTWQIGVDIDPGTYRTNPGERCYWARLRNREGGVGSIIDNNNARGGQEIVTITASDAFFESRNCGTWIPG